MRSREAAASRPSRVFLHIGAPMAGASYLRGCLARHRRRLTRAGVLYPSSHLGHDDGHLDAVLDVLDLSSTDQAPATGAWDRLAETARDWRRGTVVISHELLADATVDQVERVVASFGSAEVHVVYAARDLGRQIPMAWQEWVRNGGTATFATYVDRLVARDPHRISRVFWQSHDLTEVLERWSTFVPTDRVHVVTVPVGADQDPVLWDRFARTVGIDPGRFRAAPGTAAALDSIAGSEVLRLLNVAAGPRSDRARVDRVGRELAGVPGETPALPVVHTEWLLAESDRQVAAVKNGGYDVVGDITELIPEPDVIADDECRVTPSMDAVVAAQTRVLAAVVGPGDAEGPAGVRRRVLRRLLDR